MAKKRIQNRHFSMTRQRQVILEILHSLKSHPDADEVFNMVRKRLPRISLGTIYRNLELMSAEGLIKKIEIGQSKKRFDATIKNHYHIRCILCGKIDDLHGLRFREIDRIEKKISGFKVISHILEFCGVCVQCRKGRKRTGFSGNKKRK